MIETERLLLRPWRSADRDPFYRITSDPRVMEFYPSTLSHAESDAMIDRWQQHHQMHGYTFLAAELRETGEFIGFIGLGHTPFAAHFTPCVEIGWMLAFEHWNRGLASEGAGAALRFGFDQLRLKEIVALTATVNLRSRRVMEKLSMTRNPSDDFDHPKLPPGSPLQRHVLYRISAGARPNPLL